MISKNKTSFNILAMFLCALMLFSCSNSMHTETRTDTETSSPEEKLEMFPKPPDKIIVGHNGKSAEISPDDDSYTNIINGINKRFEQSNVFDYLLLYSFEFNEEKNQEEHLAIYLRNDETFIEYIYDNPTDQYLTMWEDTKKDLKPLKPKKIFFPLTGDLHDCFFWSESDDYQSAPLCRLTDNTELISLINSIPIE